MKSNEHKLKCEAPAEVKREALLDFVQVAMRTSPHREKTCFFVERTSLCVYLRHCRKKYQPSFELQIPASQKTALIKLYEGMLRSYCPRSRGICFIEAATELDLTEEDPLTRTEEITFSWLLPSSILRRKIN
jgi:hypothetical protein